jgi:hypothetical protein
VADDPAGLAGRRRDRASERSGGYTCARSSPCS